MNRQEYLLTCLSEECAEIIQVVGKTQRFGLDDDFLEESPRKALQREYNDLLGVVELLMIELYKGDLGYQACVVRDMIEAKKKKVLKYIEYSEKKGTLK